MSKQHLLDAIATFTAQRPGLEPRDYIRDWRDADGRANYRRESRRITRDLHHARALLQYIQWRDSITAADIIEASKRAYAGRLEIKPASDNGESFDVDYCTGQYFPTEYRRAAACVLACAIWERLREDSPGTDADHIKKAARRELGATLAREFFN